MAKLWCEICNMEMSYPESIDSAKRKLCYQCGRQVVNDFKNPDIAACLQDLNDQFNGTKHCFVEVCVLRGIIYCLFKSGFCGGVQWHYAEPHWPTES